MCWGEVLGKIIREIIGTEAPVYVELVLLDTIINPVVPPVNCFRLLLFDNIVRDSCSALIVGLDGRR